MAGGVREIPISKGYVALVDAADYEWLSRLRWCARVHTHVVYATRTHRGGGGAGPASQSMHRLIINPAPDRFVDHINGDGLDNRRANLRECSRAENGWNRQRHTPGFKGIFAKGRKWRARIWGPDGRVNLGYFATPEEAARAYDAAARELHGEFARLNFPEAEAA